MPRRHAARGFTLVEMMLVIGLFGMLAAISVPSFRATCARTGSTPAAIGSRPTLRWPARSRSPPPDPALGTPGGYTITDTGTASRPPARFRRRRGARRQRHCRFLPVGRGRGRDPHPGRRRRDAAGARSCPPAWWRLDHDAAHHPAPPPRASHARPRSSSCWSSSRSGSLPLALVQTRARGGKSGGRPVHAGRDGRPAATGMDQGPGVRQRRRRFRQRRPGPVADDDQPDLASVSGVGVNVTHSGRARLPDTMRMGCRCSRFAEGSGREYGS